MTGEVLTSGPVSITIFLPSIHTTWMQESGRRPSRGQGGRIQGWVGEVVLYQEGFGGVSMVRSI